MTLVQIFVNETLAITIICKEIRKNYTAKSLLLKERLLLEEGLKYILVLFTPMCVNREYLDCLLKKDNKLNG